MRSRLPRLMWAAPLVAVLVASVAASSESNRSEVPAPALRSISSRVDGTLSSILIEASEPVAYLTSQPDPLTVLVDLRNVDIQGLADRRIDGTQAPVSGVDIETASAPDGSPVTRVRVRLERAVRHRVRSSRNVIYVEMDRAASTPLSSVASAAAAMTPIAPSAPRVASPRQVAQASRGATAATTARAATELTDISAAAVQGGMAVTLTGNGQLVASQVEEAVGGQPHVWMDFLGVGAGRLPSLTPINAGGIERVQVATNSREPLITRVVVELARRMPYTIETIGDGVRVLFARAVDAATVTPRAAPGPVQRVVDEVPLMTDTDTTAPGAVTPPPAAATLMLAAQPQPNPVASTTQLPSAGQTVGAPPGVRFTGHPVTFDFQGADLRAVLRTFADISGLNVVIDPTIQGSVDVSLREVPWDQALDIILKANKLGYTVEGTIVRIAPLSVLSSENDERRKLADAVALSGELRVLTRALSYAKAQDLATIVTSSALSSRGEVQVDPRTNTLILRDLADRLAAADELLTVLDKPQPQVEIEARIVQTTRSSARQLGVQWGANGRLDPALGNGTNLTFPNSVGVGGRLGGQQGPGAVDTGVSLGASTPTSALGIALGSINGALNLDMALSALEASGNGRVLSTPRVSTQNNVEAEMTQGVQIPIQTVANNTITVSFKDAALTLRVTPQITASDTVIMRIAIENASPDYSRAVNGIPPIDTQRAVTSVLVADGQTTVLGGIYLSEEQVTEGRTPLLHRIPLLGWLFKNKESRDQSRELLIFITPRIAKG